MVTTSPTNLPMSVPDDIQAALAAGAVVAIGVSGGKDSQAAGLAVAEHLSSIGHAGQVCLVHADLGRVEWDESLPVSQRLADHLGLELIVVKRKAGDLMDRWLGRWANNLRRYADLECMKLIPPWSTAKMRFCTSELKTDVIAAALRKRFKTETIISVTGIRAEESIKRARMPAHQPHGKLTNKKRTAIGWTWNPIIRATKPQVFDAIAGAGLELHEAYTKYGTSRVSCRFCILASGADLSAAANADETHELYREMCDLELESTFSFQAQRWLSTVRTELLGPTGVERIKSAMDKAWRREQAEAKLPEGMLYVKHWPVRAPTMEEAEVVAEVRREVAAIMGIEIRYNTADAVLARITELLAIKGVKDAAKAARKRKKP